MTIDEPAERVSGIIAPGETVVLEVGGKRVTVKIDRLADENEATYQSSGMTDKYWHATSADGEAVAIWDYASGTLRAKVGGATT